MVARRDRSGKKITTGKAKSIARENRTGTPSKKIAAQSQSFANRLVKDGKKSSTGGKDVASAASKSVSPRQKTVPVKPRGGGLRGGMLGGGGAFGKIK